MTLIKRMAWVIDDGVITKVFYPVFPPDKSAEEVVDLASSVEVGAHAREHRAEHVRSSARRCSCCSASSDSCRTARARRPCAARRARTAPPRELLPERAQRRFVRDAAEHHDRAQLRHRRDAARQKRIAAGVDLGRRRLVLGRHAVHRVGDARIDQGQPVVRPRVVVCRARSRIRSGSRRAGRPRSRR